MGDRRHRHAPRPHCRDSRDPLFRRGLGAQARRFTILHTNDLHSHLQGVSPELDYSPLEPGNDATVGGWSRLATAIEAERLARRNPVLALDAGDFLMGSLFHLVAREQGLELGLLKAMGYDAVSLGNHEFDLMPDGLARILSAAAERGALPPVLFASAVFDLQNPKDDTLERVFASGLVQRYRVIEKEGVRFGLFAVMGKDAAEVSPFASPVSFRDPVETAAELVALLREQEKADVVICLSHSGLSKDPDKSEDVLLARQVPGIDVIVSGHTHTRLRGPTAGRRHDHRAGLGVRQAAGRPGFRGRGRQGAPGGLEGGDPGRLAARATRSSRPASTPRSICWTGTSWPRTGSPTPRCWPRPAST